MCLSLYEDFYKRVDKVDIKIYLCTIFYSNKCTFLLQYILTGLKLPVIYDCYIWSLVLNETVLVGTWKVQMEIRVMLYAILRKWSWLIRLWLNWFGIGLSKNSILLLVLHFWGCKFRVLVVFFNIILIIIIIIIIIPINWRYTLALFKEYFITLPFLDILLYLCGEIT